MISQNLNFNDYTRSISMNIFMTIVASAIYADVSALLEYGHKGHQRQSIAMPCGQGSAAQGLCRRAKA